MDADHDIVGGAMIATFDLGDFPLPGECARSSDCVQRGFGSGVGKANVLD
jgi:hypothetical protein